MVSGFNKKIRTLPPTHPTHPTLQPSIETAVRTSRSTTPWPRKFSAPLSSRTCWPSSVPCVTWKRDWLTRGQIVKHGWRLVVSPQKLNGSFVGLKIDTAYRCFFLLYRFVFFLSDFRIKVGDLSECWELFGKLNSDWLFQMVILGWLWMLGMEFGRPW